MGVIELLAFVAIGYLITGAFLLCWLEKVGNNYSQKTERN
ncbi:hypothetical protein HG1285_14784 [Hydrogenivirga sp. 128-5-R1-1]|nr:hypothetical protein HG1285_14784 [Hydrogenivirga sp. 128-5-R1-1]